MGAGGFIGSHMVRFLSGLGYWVRGVDLKYPEFSETDADDFVIGDLRDRALVRDVLVRPLGRAFDEVYQFAADMGGAGYAFTGDNDADIMHNSASINLNVVDALRDMATRSTTVFYSSSACIYPERNQVDPERPHLEEGSAYPADPDSEYGWEKLFSERIYLAFARNHGISVRIARYHSGDVHRLADDHRYVTCQVGDGHRVTDIYRRRGQQAAGIHTTIGLRSSSDGCSIGLAHSRAQRYIHRHLHTDGFQG